VTIRGGVRSLNARLARLEQRVPEPQGPIVYRVYFHDGTPVWPGPDDGVGIPSEEPDIVYRIASWEETSLGVPTPRTSR
jgi:hypothetical protein